MAPPSSKKPDPKPAVKPADPKPAPPTKGHSRMQRTAMVRNYSTR